MNDNPVPNKSPLLSKTLADLILAYLVSIKVEYIFGIPGGAVEPLYNSLARESRTENPRIKSVVARHEAGAAFMADGYARETGRLGVCCATTGPGATNLITGVASAYADRVPMLVITPQTALPNFGRRSLQESSSDGIDTVAMFESCTRYNSLVSHPNQLEGKLFAALISAFRRPQGPVHLSIPMDILNMEWNGSSTFQLCKLLRQPEMIDDYSLDTLCEKLIKSRKLVLLMGGGCREASEAILEFARMSRTQIIATPAGKSWVNAYDPLFRGVFGFAGHSSAREALMDDDIDYIIAVGTSLGEMSTGGWDAVLLNEKLIHIEETAENFSRSPMASLHVFGHLKTIFKSLTQMCFAISLRDNNMHLNQSALTTSSTTSIEDSCAPEHIVLDDLKKYLSNKAPIKPQRVMCGLAKRFPKDTRFVSDAGNSWAWTTHYLHPQQGGHYHIGLGFGAMAWGIGAAIGLALGAPGKVVVCITGDGSYLMSGQEITVAVQHKLPVVYVVLNDSALGMVKHGQQLGGGEPIGFELPLVDYAAVARAMGAQGFTIKSPKDLIELDIEAIYKTPGPTLLDVYIDAQEVPPMASRLDALDRRVPRKGAA